MSKKLTPELVESAAKQTGISEEQRLALLQMLADMVEPEVDEEKPPAVKKQFVFVCADADGRVAGALKSVGLDALTGWVVQIPEEAAPQSATEKIKESAHRFNCTKKGRMMPVQTVGEAIENVPDKITKEQQVWRKHRTPIYAILTANELPDTPSVLGNDRGSYAKHAA
jgi:hypothetical protein